MYKRILFLFLFFGFYALVFAQNEENITLETYYPSPYGSYKAIQLYPIDEPGNCNSDNEGAIYFNNTFKRPYYCNGTTWELLGNPFFSYFWDFSGGKIFNMNKGNVGVFASDSSFLPEAKLYILRDFSLNPDFFEVRKYTDITSGKYGLDITDSKQIVFNDGANAGGQPTEAFVEGNVYINGNLSIASTSKGCNKDIIKAFECFNSAK